MKTFYVACPADFFTGGTLALHQLCFQLKKLNQDSKIYFFNQPKFSKKRNVSKKFKKFDLEYVYGIDDSKNNCLIVPETSTHILKKFKKITKVIWWLSVDNYISSKKFYSKSLKNKFLAFLGIVPISLNMLKNNSNILNLTQSHYSACFLKENGIFNFMKLGCYLDDVFFQSPEHSTNRKNIVLYNPKKGINFTKKLISNAHNLEFKPLINLTQEEISNLLCESKLYIDFGNHPGRDRFPREAVISGCCIITNFEGSARNNIDIPIPNKYKFNPKFDSLNDILKKIEDVFENYSECYRDFENYRKIIRSELQEFEIDLKNFLVELNSST